MVSPLSSDGSSANVDFVDDVEASNEDIRVLGLQRQLHEAAVEVDEVRYELNFQRAHANWTQLCYNEEVARAEGLLLQVIHHSAVAKKWVVYGLTVTTVVVFLVLFLIYREIFRARNDWRWPPS